MYVCVEVLCSIIRALLNGLQDHLTSCLSGPLRRKEEPASVKKKG